MEDAAGRGRDVVTKEKSSARATNQIPHQYLDAISSIGLSANPIREG